MRIAVRHVSLGNFVIAIAGFFLPFMTASCPGYEVELTGIEVALGKKPEPGSPQFMGDREAVDSNPQVMMALAMAGVGVAASVAAGPGPRLLGAVLGLGGAVLLMAFRMEAIQQVTGEGNGVVSLEFEIGYWMALLGLVAAGAANVLAFTDRRNRASQGLAIVSGEER